VVERMMMRMQSRQRVELAKRRQLQMKEHG